MKARPLIFSRAKKEPWQEECYRAYVSVLMLNEDQAYFEVSKNSDSVLYYPGFWYGNQGGHMCHTRPCGNKEEAMKLCQEEFDRLISENAIDSIAECLSYSEANTPKQTWYQDKHDEALKKEKS